MRVKRNNNRPESSFSSAGDKAPENLHMPTMDTVKVANGDY
jgi:hypothetical protein